MNGELILDWLYFPGEYLRAAVVVSLLSVWVLIGLSYYLNHYTKRRYFSTWTAAWLFYALWLTMLLSLQSGSESPLLLMLKQWCVGVSAVFLVWGATRFLGQRASQKLFALFIGFLFVWSYVSAFHLEDSIQAQLPIFALIGLCSVVTAGCFWQLRRQKRYMGAGLLAVGFALWGLYLAGYPLMQTSLVSAGFFISAVLQLFIAVSMIILVLEEVRASNQEAMEQIRSQRLESAKLKTRVLSTEERYRSLFDQASEGIIITAADDLRILELNQTAKRLLGLGLTGNQPESLAKFCRTRPDGPELEDSSEWFTQICQQRRLNLTGKDGSLTPVEVDGAPISFEGRAAYQFFLREQTEMARMEQQLRQSEKLSALGRMISGIAHELNNPLAVIKGYLELVLSRHELAPQTRTDLEKVAHESNRAAKLVSNFLSFAREQPAHRRSVQLNDLVRRVMEVRQGDLSAAGVEARLETDPYLLAIQADPDQVHQVLVILVNNALHALSAAPQPRRLTLRTELLGPQVRLIVEDNGPGVPEALVPRIFEPFFTTKEVGAGTGLGLSIAHSIMSDHHGRIFYQAAPDGGAGFVVEFPLVEPAGSSIASQTEVAVRSDPSPAPIQPSARILVLDDEHSITELLCEMLGLLGYRTKPCHAPLHALELLAAEEFDLVLSDFRMPGLDGQEFFQRAVARRPELARRIVFLTGDVVNEETQAFLQSTGNPYLAKPFQLAKVERTVAQVLEQPRAAGSPR